MNTGRELEAKRYARYLLDYRRREAGLRPLDSLTFATLWELNAPEVRQAKRLFGIAVR